MNSTPILTVATVREMNPSTIVNPVFVNEISRCHTLASGLIGCRFSVGSTPVGLSFHKPFAILGESNLRRCNPDGLHALLDCLMVAVGDSNAQLPECSCVRK